MALDDATRLVYGELLPNEPGRTTARFTIRPLCWFAAHGVRVERILSDNGAGYRSRPFTRVALGRLPADPPQTNGEVERRIGSALRECLYREVFHSSEQRRPVCSARSITTIVSALTWPSRGASAGQAAGAHAHGVIVTNLAGDHR